MTRPTAATIRHVLIAFLFAASSVSAQEKPLSRAFSDGSKESYRVQVSLRAEVRGVSTEKAAEKTYVKPFVHVAKGSVDWTSSLNIKVSAEATPEIEETQEHFSMTCATTEEPGAETQALQRSLEQICSQLRVSEPMHYSERNDGLIRNLPAPGDVSFSEKSPPLLALWFRRALRPDAILPALAFRPGTRNQRPILTPSGMKGSETTEWMDSGANASDAVLHVVQELSWAEPGVKSGFSNVGGAPPGTTVFFSDSNTVLSPFDGSVVRAIRTASRETKRTLEPVDGLPAPPEFSSKLTVVVTIRRLP